MEKIIATRHQEIHNSTKDFIMDELIKVEGDYKKLTSARVVLDKERNSYLAEVILHGKHINIEAEGKAEQLYPAIVDAIEKARKQLKKVLDKRRNHHQH